MNRIRFSCFALLAAAAVACNKDDIITREEAQAPVIAFDVNTGVYTAKVGREFTIAPTYEYVDRAVYAWKLEKTGRIISTEPVLTYVIDEVEGEEKEDYYIELEVTTPQGTTREQTRVEVYRILPPVIVLSEGAEVVRGHVYEISPDVRWGEKATYRWTMRRPGAAEVEEVGREPTYEFCEQALGEYELRLRAENEDGADEKSIRVEVTEALPVSVTVPPIGRLYDGLTRTVPLGRSITLRPLIWNGRNPRYSWTVDGEEISTELACTYTPSGKGVKKLLFTVTDSSDEPAAAVAKGVRSTGEVRATVEYSVECCDEEGAFRRPATPSSEVSWTKVYEYTPAPGQFINELVSGGFTGAETTPEAAVAYAEERLRKGTWVSLGGWGGYIVVGFDHSIDNSSEGYRGGYNFSITGNAFEGSSEPGIVWVMQDTNGNTLPDDEWYELKGSEFGKEETLRDYAVTYYRPTYSGASVQWRDNRGVSGKIDYLKAYHDQPSYYPNWIDAESYV
ncbi:MAG: hypothetical protein KA237_04440, partial [Alistipes sp.]|nr:hypothetical protein [Alistipes sp.]